MIDELAAEDPKFTAAIRRMPENVMEYYEHLPLDTPADSPVVAAVTSAIAAITGRQPDITTRRGWTDAALLGMAGIPTVVCGPGDISFSHSRGEKIGIDALEKAVLIYALTAVTFCGLNE